MNSLTCRFRAATASRWHRAAVCGPFCLGLFLAGASPAWATELVYYPINPSFGGSPLNAPGLLNSALATNKHKDSALDEDIYGINAQSPLQNFNDILERSVLNRLATAVSSRILGEDGLFKPGRLETDNFTIDVVDVGGGTLMVNTIDKLTGGSNLFQVGK